MLKAVGCADSTVQIVSLDPDTTLDTLSLQVNSCELSLLVEVADQHIFRH